MSEVRKMLTIEDVLDLIPVSRTTLWRMVRDAQFPKAHIVRGQNLWYGDELVAWQDGLSMADVHRVSRRKRA